MDEKCIFKPPLSDSLNNLKSYAQLWTFTLSLIAEFSDGRIIESAQNVLDRMLTPRSEENDAIDEIWGAPDPTAGAGENDLILMNFKLCTEKAITSVVPVLCFGCCVSLQCVELLTLVALIVLF